ncbi:hypothetical protein [Butyricimonas virosa]|uniref:hypothetical protein n=1 Tax=Butyricimonas virosa TaxID=544645 RepID=UPI00266DC58A|nr:hypothetical protein [Butyricimonas virosa]
MVLQNDMPLSDVITMSLKGEERELHERDLRSYVENLSRGGKEALQQALKEVETAIAGWNDWKIHSYLPPSVHFKVIP